LLGTQGGQCPISLNIRGQAGRDRGVTVWDPEVSEKKKGRIKGKVERAAR